MESDTSNIVGLIVAPGIGDATRRQMGKHHRKNGQTPLLIADEATYHQECMSMAL
jgi:hypothetical protein